MFEGIINDSPFAAQDLYLADKYGNDLLVVVIQATYAISEQGKLDLLAEQPAIAVGGTYNGEGGNASYRYEPQYAPYKMATDIALIGHAYAMRPGDTHVDVSFQVGPVGKSIRVFGDRQWYRRMGRESMTAPQPLETMPLVYERAYGGWDRSPVEEAKHTVESRNPVGVGYFSKKYGTFEDGVALPNLEDPKHPIKHHTDTPPPAGFGFIGPDWAPRSSYVGTYDKAWEEHRMPLLPTDFDDRFYNAATPDLIAPGYLRGNERVALVNVTPVSRVQFYLPGEPPPVCQVVMNNQTKHSPKAQLDTIIVDTDAMHVVLMWRGQLAVSKGQVYDIRAIRIEPDKNSSHAQTPQFAIL